MYTLTLVLFSIVAKFASGLRNGAPPKSCKSMTPGHIGSGIIPLIDGQPKPSRYSFDATWDNKLKMVRVSVSGDPVAGFLIQGRLNKDGPAVGSFVNITENPDAKYQDCSADKFDPESSVTHTTASSDKENLVFFWQPPKGMNKTENVTFYGTLARTREVFWVMQESNSLDLSALEDDKPVTTKTPSEATNQTKTAHDTTEKVMSSTEPTNSKGSNTVSVGVSSLSILLIINIKISMS